MLEISEIKIPNSYLQSTPKRKKIDEAIEYYKLNGRFDRPIVINNENILVDNYARYIAALELGINKINCANIQEYKAIYPTLYPGKKFQPKTINNHPKLYVIGKFQNCNKEYTWINKHRLDISVGDKIVVSCNNKRGYGIVTVVEVFESSDSNLKHKRVIKKLSK